MTAVYPSIKELSNAEIIANEKYFSQRKGKAYFPTVTLKNDI